MLVDVDPDVLHGLLAVVVDADMNGKIFSVAVHLQKEMLMQFGSQNRKYAISAMSSVVQIQRFKKCEYCGLEVINNFFTLYL